MDKSNHISKASGFKVPEGYFTDNAMDLAKLKGTENKSGFEVPENYFKALRIQSRPAIPVNKASLQATLV